MKGPETVALEGIARLLPLFRGLTHLKRIRVAGEPGSLAQRLFRRSWLRLVAGEEPEAVALQETAHAVASRRRLPPGNRLRITAQALPKNFSSAPIGCPPGTCASV